MVKEYTHLFHSKVLQNFPIFLFENIPSGNPEFQPRIAIPHFFFKCNPAIATVTAIHLQVVTRQKFLLCNQMKPVVDESTHLTVLAHF
jgi:hypothetical protein